MSFAIRSILVSSLLALLTPWASAQTEEELRAALERRIKELEAELEARRGPADPGKPTDPATRLRWYDQHVQMKDASAFKELKWQFLGPTNVSGRVTDVAVPTPRGKSYTIYAATASGGVWRTENEGTTWEPIFDEAPTTSIGDVTLAPSNPDIIWIGTGEANIFRSSMAGCGVYKSTDRGATWQHMGLGATHTIPRIVIHPTNPDIVYVASSGHEWTDNEERGVYKSVDGGKTWDKCFFVNEKTGVIDLVMHPTEPDTLWAATWQRIRKRWHDPRNEPDYDGSGVYKSVDAGKTWVPVNEGLPAPQHRGRIGLDVCQAQPRTLYAFVDCYEKIDDTPSGTDSYGRQRTGAIKGAQIYRSDDGGVTWRMTSKNDRTMQRASSTYGWVFGQVRADPVDPDTVYMMGLSLKVSNDSGATFRNLRGMHVDQHALFIDPANTKYLVNGNDGGLAISYDGGLKWRTTRDNLPAVQFYNVGYDMDTPFRVYGSIQDHGSRRGTVDLRRGRSRIRPSEWEGAPGGEASIHAVDPTDPEVIYSEGFYGSISRTDHGVRKGLKPKDRAGEPRLRGQWLAPFIISPHNPRIIYHGMNHLFRSFDRGDNWERISPDLSYADASQLGDIPYQTIWAISESPLKFGLIYAGTDDGRLHVTPDGGTTWNEITAGLAPRRWISRAIASRFDLNTVYVAQNGKRNDDFTAYLWRSKDRGKAWQDISTGIPGGPINVIREDPENRDILYVGTDTGVYVTTDGAKTWHVLANGLPSTFVHDLIIHPRDDMMVIATHGRGMYAMDVRPIRGEEPEEEPEPRRRRRGGRREGREERDREERGDRGEVREIEEERRERRR